MTQALLLGYGAAAVSPGVHLLLHLNGTNGSTVFTDTSIQVKTVTGVGNAQLSTAQQRFGTASALFDGTGDRLTVPSAAAFDFSAGDFTLEAWVRLTLSGSNSQFHGVFAKRATTAVFAPFALTVVGDGSILALSSVDAATWAVNISSATGVVASNTWTHVAMVREGTRFSIYAGTSGTGNRVATATPGAITVMSNAADVSIGASAAGGGFDAIGHIDEVRITRGTAQYTGTTYTVPTTEFPDP